jgi:hypothetical protein
VGPSSSSSPRVVLDGPGRRPSSGLWVPGAMKLDVNIASRHSLLLGAQGPTDIQELLLALVRSQSRAGFWLSGPDQLHWCWEELFPSGDDAPASARVGGSPAQWLISYHDDCLSRLVGGSPRSLDWLATHEEQRHRVKVAVEAALAPDPA